MEWYESKRVKTNRDTKKKGSKINNLEEKKETILKYDKKI